MKIKRRLLEALIWGAMIGFGVAWGYYGDALMCWAEHGCS
jgi:hypothetical protein